MLMGCFRSETKKKERRTSSYNAVNSTWHWNNLKRWTLESYSFVLRTQFRFSSLVLFFVFGFSMEKNWKWNAFVLLFILFFCLHPFSQFTIRIDGNEWNGPAIKGMRANEASWQNKQNSVVVVVGAYRLINISTAHVLESIAQKVRTIFR